jgi:hypothetical protein
MVEPAERLMEVHCCVDEQVHFHVLDSLEQIEIDAALDRCHHFLELDA